MKTLMVVDDDQQVREMLTLMLRQAGYDVVAVDDGAHVLAALGEHPADLVLIDILMPEKEGLGTIREVRAAFPGIRVVAMSGGGVIAADLYLELAKRMGADRTIAKPCERAELLGLIGELLGPAT